MHFTNDSLELAMLREHYRRAHPDSMATPGRLGAYAKHRGKVITDYGGHSSRWIRQFKQGAARP